MLALLMLVAALQTSPAPSATTPAAAAPLASPVPADDPAITKLARTQYEDFAAGKIDASQYSVQVPAAALPEVQAFLSALGPVKSVVLVQKEDRPEGTVYVYKFTCENGAALEQLSIKDGKINGIYFRPVT